MAPEDQPPDVLSSLPRTRPQRRSAKRDAAPKSARKPSAANGVKAASKPRTATAKPAAKARAKPRAAAKPRAVKTKDARIPPAGFETPRDQEERPLPGGVELIGTAIQAAGELAQIGIAVGGQALKSILRRGN